MEGSIISEQEIQLQAEQPPNPESQTAKKGKSLHKTVVTVKVVACGGKQRNEGPPSDSWSWRKYGQKPIKGSPYPRGYYRCSTSKGCSAKKQVERCRIDASMLIITYTSSHNHNHPGPNFHNSINQTSQTPQMQAVSSLEMRDEPEQKQPELEEQEQNSTEHFHYFEPLQEVSNHIDHNPFSVDLDSGQESLGVLFDEELISFPPIRTSEKPESDEYDFFDELEELPMSSLPFRSFMTSSFHSDRILVQPS